VSSWVPLPARDRFESRCRVPAHCVLALALVVNPFSKYRFSFTADGTSLWHSPRFALELLQLMQVADPSPVSGRRDRVAGEDVEFDQVDRGRDFSEVRVFVWCCRQPGGGGVLLLIHESSDLESQGCDSRGVMRGHAEQCESETALGRRKRSDRRNVSPQLNRAAQPGRPEAARNYGMPHESPSGHDEENHEREWVMDRRSNGLATIPVRAFGDGIRSILAASADSFDQATLLVTGSGTGQLEGSDAIVVLVGPQRWHPSRRGPLVDSIGTLGGRCGLVVGVYPVRPTDIKGQADIGQQAAGVTEIVAWMRAGTSLLESDGS